MSEIPINVFECGNDSCLSWEHFKGFRKDNMECGDCGSFSFRELTKEEIIKRGKFKPVAITSTFPAKA